jgi:SHS2 domain-containing protein
MGTWRTVDHTADVGLRIEARDLDDLFRTAGEALMSMIVVDLASIRPEVEEEVEVRGEDPADLLAAWLTEILYRVETRGMVYGRFEARVARDGRSVAGRIAGEPMDRERHELDHEVKAVTRHGLLLQREADCWVGEVILDI